METNHVVTEKDQCGECVAMTIGTLFIIFLFCIFLAVPYFYFSGKATEPVSKVKNASVCIKDQLNNDFLHRSSNSVAPPTVSEFDNAKNLCHSAAVRKEEGLA